MKCYYFLFVVPSPHLLFFHEHTPLIENIIEQQTYDKMHVKHNGISTYRTNGSDLFMSSVLFLCKRILL